MNLVGSSVILVVIMIDDVGQGTFHEAFLWGVEEVR